MEGFFFRAVSLFSSVACVPVTSPMWCLFRGRLTVSANTSVFTSDSSPLWENKRDDTQSSLSKIHLKPPTNACNSSTVHQIVNTHAVLHQLQLRIWKKKKIYIYMWMWRLEVRIKKIKEYSSKVLKCFIFSLLICRLSTGLQFSHVKIKIAEGKICIIYSAAYGTGSGQTTDLEENWATGEKGLWVQELKQNPSFVTPPSL